MPNHKSAKKRVKTNKRDEIRNKAAKSAVKTAVKKSVAAIATGDIAGASSLLRDTQALIGRTWRRGIIHKNKMARLQSRLMAKAARAAQSK